MMLSAGNCGTGSFFSTHVNGSIFNKYNQHDDCGRQKKDDECPPGIDVAVRCFDILTFVDGMSDFCVYVQFNHTLCPMRLK